MVKSVWDSFAAWRERQFLKRHAVSSMREYELKYDTDIRRSAHLITDYFHGYAGGIVAVEWPVEFYDMFKWLNENKIQFRSECFRVCQNQEDGWYFDEMGGLDVVFIAFKKEADRILFLLRWL